MFIMEYLGYSFLENYQIITKYFELVKNKLQIFLEHIVDYLKKFLLHLNFFKFNLQISNKYKFNQNIHNILCYFLLK